MNSGTLSSSEGYAVEFDNGAANSLVNSGTVQGSSAVLMACDSAKLSNVGNIDGTIAGVFNGIVNDIQTLRLNHSGTIVAQSGSALQSGGKVVIYNTGAIEGGDGSNARAPSLELGTSADIVRNFGTLHGDALFGAGNDLMHNGGGMDGSVFLDAGNDIFNGRGGLVEGTVYGGEGQRVRACRGLSDSEFLN